jgi:hypothetical protein
MTVLLNGGVAGASQQAVDPSSHAVVCPTLLARCWLTIIYFLFLPFILFLGVRENGPGEEEGDR